MASNGGKAGSLVVLLVCVASALLIGCGSSSNSSSSSSTTASTPTTSTAAGASSTETSSTSTTAAGAGGTTAAGTKLQPGATALVDYQPGSTSSNPPTYRLKVAVLSIKKGAQSDLNGIELEKAQQGQVPYYVTLQVTNEGSGNAAAEDGNPSVGFQATDDRGQQGQELTILGTFRPCESKSVPKQFTRGVTFTTCALYMVGGGGSIVSESWTGSGGDAYSEHPIVWAAG